MKVSVFAMPTIPATLEERERLKPIARNTERYQTMLGQLRDLVGVADDLGYDAFSTTEHHFQTEGAEATPNTLLTYSHLASYTKNLKFIPMSVVLPAADPIRVAEDIALFDQMYPGRIEVCFARGYQIRWMQVLSQGGPTALLGRDDLSREIFDEYLDIVIKAWTEDAFNFDGKFYKVPYPFEGIEGWAGTNWTNRFGAAGELDENGVIKKIGVIPRPYQDPHPRIWVPFTISPATLYAAAKRGSVPLMYSSQPDQFLHWCRVYQEENAKEGRNFGLGDNVACMRAISIGDTFEEAAELAAKTAAYEYHNYFNEFGMGEAHRTPEDPPDEFVRFKSERDGVDRMIKSGQLLCGTPEQIKRQLEPLTKCHADGHLEWLVWTHFAQGTVPPEVANRQLERFATEVLPSFK